MNEEWKTIQGYSEYQVSDFGRVRSLNYHRQKTAKVLSSGDNGCGYKFVYLYKNKKPHRFLIHRLVAQAFLPNPLNLPQVNHKDENPSNNRVDNLEWCDNKYNCNYGDHRRKLS